MVSGVALALFIGGVAVGRWATQEQIVYRLRQAIAEWRAPKPAAGEGLALAGAWRPVDTHLHGLEVARVKLAGISGRGGGLEQLQDGRIFYATGHGGFGVVENDGKARTLDFQVEMNIEGLKRHPVFDAPTFSFFWFRVTDIMLAPMEGDRYRLLVGHHFYDEARRCVELRLSRGELSVDGAALTLSKPFETITTTKPCITFFGPDWGNAFEGHFSGGRLVALPNGRVLWSTGDHGYVGVRGYPALSQDKSSTLGKILSVDPNTGQAELYAWGVRNPQGLTRDAEGRIWETEHGPKGGDELNLIVKGGDYGWPYNTLGTDYGPKPWPLNKTQGRHDSGIKPVFSWTPSIGISNLIAYDGVEFPLWRGDLLVGTLYPSSIYRARLDGDRVMAWEQISFGGVDDARIRDIMQMKDGRIALMTDEGELLLLRNRDNQAGAKPYLDPETQERLTADMSDAERAAAIAEGETYGAAAKLSAQAQRGKELHKELCLTCHTVTGSSGVGPSHRGLVGRAPGAADFSYSDDLRKSGPTWTGASAAAFANNPQATHPGSTMAAVPMTDAQQRDLAAYLETLK
jgi:cytochrome c2